MNYKKIFLVLLLMIFIVSCQTEEEKDKIKQEKKTMDEIMQNYNDNLNKAIEYREKARLLLEQEQ